VRSDELWLWQGLGPLRLRLGGTGPAPEPESELVVGPDPGAGHLLQALVPAGAWQAAEPLTGAGALVGCVVAPGFDYTDFELAEG
jgi:predicted cupin superfamily sugar epimerase